MDVVIVDVLQNDRTEKKKNNPYILHVHEAKTCFALTDFQFKKALAKIFSISSSAVFSITLVPSSIVLTISYLLCQPFCFSASLC